MKTRMMWLPLSVLHLCFLLNFSVPVRGESQDALVYYAPALERYAQIEPAGETIIPNGRVLTPAGRQIILEPHPYGLTINGDASCMITINSGTEPFSISIIDQPLASEPVVTQIPEGIENQPGILNACFMGAAFAPAPDEHILWVSGGDDGTVMAWDLRTHERRATIDLNVPFAGHDFEDSYTGDLRLSRDGKRLYVVDQMNFRVVVVDTPSATIRETIPVGRYPFGIALGPDEERLYVANIGMFEYKPVEGLDPSRIEATGLSFPAFPYGSKEMIEGTVVDGIKVPGLGDPNAPEAVSVYVIRLDPAGSSEVEARIKTGILVGTPVDGIPAVGGAAPNSIVATEQHVFVSNGTNDSISVIDRERNEKLDPIRLRLGHGLERLRGIIPFGLALSPDGTRLFVAESGINAVGVIDIQTRTVVGHIPVGWFPSKLSVSPDGKYLMVANAKGFGSGPNGGPHVDLGGRSGIGHLMRGSVSIIPMPNDKELKGMTTAVVRNNVGIGQVRPWDDAGRRNPVPPYPGAYESPIKHVVFIAKENRTYDQVYGEMQGGRGEPSLADFGLDRTVRSSGRPDDVIEHVNVMPNHQRLARQFASTDNFYCDSDHSADGHRWLQGVYPGVFCETSTSASYGGRRGYDIHSTAPGRRGVTGASAALIPEDYIEAGSLWEHLERSGVRFFNFGLGFEFPGVAEGFGKDYKFTGVIIPANYPLPAPLWDRTSRRFATYNTNIPDQFRVDMFERDLEERWLSGTEPFPQVITMSLPNDHGAGERPDAGYPFRESYMADNDLALARVVQRLSRLPQWREMAIIVTEDDAQNGRDHVDAHRSLCLVISPYAKRGTVSHVHTSIPSILKTMNLILGIPFINQFDAMTSDLSDMFQPEPDFTPYEAVPVHPQVFDPQAALNPYDAEFDWDTITDYPRMDDPGLMKKWMEEDARQRTEQHLLDN